MPKKTPAADRPVARVLPLLRQPHLDRGFDYQVAEEDSAAAQPGVRVRIRFNGQLQDAIVLERLEGTDYEGDLRFIERVVSPFVVYPDSLRRLVESLADRYAGTRADIIRTAIPPRHAQAEESDFDTGWDNLGAANEPDLSSWSAYVHGESFVDAVLGGSVARAAWQIAPGDDWAAALAALAAKVAIDGGGVIIVVPHQRAVDALEQALRAVVGPKQITVLSNSLGPQARYRRYLSAVTGQARIVIGTRSAAYAPVANLRLAVILNDGDDNLVDNLKPYVHAREVLTTRSALEGCSLIVAGHSRTAEAALLVQSGWAHDLLPADAALTKRRPMITAVGPYGINVAREAGGTSAMGGPAYQAVRASLERGEPVLVQVPRKGYMPVLACGSCRTPARCRHCNGPLGIPTVGPGTSAQSGAATVPTCTWCGRPDAKFACPSCGSRRVRSMVLGQELTAQELGNAFPSTRVVVSGGNRVIDEVPAEPALVIATPGAEPRVAGGGHYGAAWLLDTGALLGRQDLRATEDALAKWAAAATLVAPAAKGGHVVIAADGQLPVVQALMTWDMAGAAAAELEVRRAVRFPPAVHLAAVDGPAAALHAFREVSDLPEGAEVLGPVPLPPGNPLPGEYDMDKFGAAQRLLVRTPPGPRSALGQALRQAQATRAARKDDLPLRVQVDPIHIG